MRCPALLAVSAPLLGEEQSAEGEVNRVPIARHRSPIGNEPSVLPSAVERTQSWRQARGPFTS